MKFSNFFITYTTVLRLGFCTENCMLFGSPHVLHSSDKNTANQRKKINGVNCYLGTSQGLFDPTQMYLTDSFIYYIYLCEYIWGLSDCLGCVQTSRPLSSVDQIRVVTYVTSRTSRFIKKNLTEPLKSILLVVKIYRITFVVLSYFKHKLFFFFSSLYHCLKKLPSDARR